MIHESLMSKDKSITPITPLTTDPAPAAKPTEVPPATPAPAAVSRYHVATSDGQSGEIEAASIDAAKYGFMRLHGICDRGGTIWTITKL